MVMLSGGSRKKIVGGAEHIALNPSKFILSHTLNHVFRNNLHLTVCYLHKAADMKEMVISSIIIQLIQGNSQP